MAFLSILAAAAADKVNVMRVEICARPASAEACCEAGAASRQQRSAALAVRTAEGDTVTLRLASLEEGAVYSAPGGFGALRESQQTVEVEVNGDLNRRELADLGKLLRLLGRSVRELNRGDQERALKPLARIPLLDTLAQVSFAYRHEAEYGAFRSLPAAG